MLNSYYNRIVKVFAGEKGSERAVAVESLKIDFSVTKDENKENNEATITIWNMSNDTRSIFEQTGTSIVIQAGYESTGAGVLFSGTVQRTEPVYSGADVGLSMEVSDGADILSDKFISKSWSGKVFPDEVVNFLVKDIGSPFRIEGAPLPRKPYNNGYVAYGSPLTVLEKVLGRIGYIFNIQDGEIKIYPREGGIFRSVFEISPTTGMIGYPKKLNLSKRDRRRRGNKVGYSVRMLLNSSLAPGGRLRIKSRTVTGEFRIVNIEHNGSNWEDDYSSTVEVYEL